MPDNFVQTSPVTKYNSACQYATHTIIRFYIILLFYILRHTLYQPVICARYTAACNKTTQVIIRFYIILQLYIQTNNFSRQPVTCARKYCPLQNTFQRHIIFETFLLFLIQGQGWGLGYGYCPIIRSPTISLNHYTRLHKLLIFLFLRYLQVLSHSRRLGIVTQSILFESITQ